MGCLFTKLVFPVPQTASYTVDQLQAPPYIETRTVQGGGSHQILVVRIHPRDCPRHPTDPVIVYSHGNAVDLGIVVQTLLLHRASLPANVTLLSYEYTGYGPPEVVQPGDRPSERALKSNARHVARYIVQEYPNDVTPLLFWGRSLGSHMAIEAASALGRRTTGLILESPFLSCAATVTGRPLWRAFDMFDNTRAMRKLYLHKEEDGSAYLPPLLVMHGTDDRVVPYRHGVKLFHDYQGSHKTFEQIPDAAHNNIHGDPGSHAIALTAVATFVSSVCRAPSGPDQRFADNYI